MKFILHFLSLEWKSFSRSASFGTNLAIKILLAILALLYSFALLSMGIGLYYGLKENHLDPLVQINTFLIYYFLFDLGMRFLWQKIPVMNIRPMLILPIKKSTIVHFSLGKTALSFFNLISQWCCSKKIIQLRVFFLGIWQCFHWCTSTISLMCSLATKTIYLEFY